VDPLKKGISRRSLLAGGLALAGLPEMLSSKSAGADSAQPPAFPVTINVDASRPVGEMKPIWRFFGADEPNYATMRDGKKLLGEQGALAPNHVYFRTHNLLTTGDGTPDLKWGSTNAYTEDAQGNPVYSWTILDGIFDTYRARGVRPYVQIGFMPQALSVRPEPYRHHWTPRARYEEIYTGWAYPPKDYTKWAELVYQWARHCVARYGRREVETWYWEVWNEPNIGYWRGTPEEFHKLHDYAVDAVRRALPTAKVGGPDVAGGGGKFLGDFLQHCLHGTNHATGKVGTPLDFVSFHAKGAPTFVNAPDGGSGHVRMGIANQLRDINAGFAQVASFPELKKTPIVIGESDPDGCAACQSPQLGYRNGAMYSSYTAASFARKYLLADRHGVNLEGALTWAFEFENQPLFAGFRVLATGGIDLPVLNVFRILSRMGSGQRVSATSSGQVSLDAILLGGVRGDSPDVGTLAAVDGGRLALLVWHYHDDDLPGPDAEIDVLVEGLPESIANSKGAKFQHWRIDQEHSNAFTAWKRMGSPASPTPEQYKQLEKAGQLARLKGAPATVSVEDGKARVRFTLPRQGVSLLMFG
jgi:xylan 1,4-beta-xylosidase